jgi:hypothetical protein
MNSAANAKTRRLMRKEFIEYLDRAGIIIILTFVSVGYILAKGQELKNLQLQIPMILSGIALSLVGEVMSPWTQKKFPGAKRKLAILFFIGTVGYIILILDVGWMALDNINTAQKATRIQL